MDSVDNQINGRIPALQKRDRLPLTPVDERLEAHAVKLHQLDASQLATARQYSTRVEESIDQAQSLPQSASAQAAAARPSGDKAADSYTLQIPGPNGTVTASVRRKDGFFETLFEDDTVYEVTADGHTFDVECVAALIPQSRQYITIILQELVKIPPHLRSAVETVRLTNERNPADAYWAKQYNIPGFESAATAGDGEITVWGLTPQNAEGRLRHSMSHEVGHLVGESVRQGEQGLIGKLFPSGEKYPAEWPNAIKADKRPVDTGLKVGEDGRNYSESSPGEDFAEAFKLYVRARMGGESELRSFNSTYPNRGRLLAEIWERK